MILRVKELEEIVAKLKRDNDEKAKIIAEQAKQIEELKAKLVRYENPHTPPSAQRYNKESKSRNPQKKHSVPNGRHRGATRPTPEPDKVVEVTADQCNHCGSTNLEERSVEKQVIEGIPPPPKIVVIQFNRHKYKC